MPTTDSTKRAVVAAAAASFALAAPATADDLGLRISRGVAPSTLPNSSNLAGTGLGVGAGANAGLDLNPVTEDPANFQSSRLTVPDALDRLSIRSDSKGKASLLYKFVNTKF
jgi:hypothetical protein